MSTSTTPITKTVYIIGGRRKQYDTAAEAIRVANATFDRTGVVLSVEARIVRPRVKSAS